MQFLILQGKTLCIDSHTSVQSVFDQNGLPLELFSFTINGRSFSPSHLSELPQYCIIRASMTLPGGKGGYGAKLKTEGGKKVRPNDNMFSRDMSGQRIVNATIQRDYKQFIAKKIEEDKQVAKEREQFKVMESTLKEGQSFMKLDKAYKRQVEETQNMMMNSIMKGKQKLMERSQKKQEGQKEEVKQEVAKEEVKQEEKQDVISQQPQLKKEGQNEGQQAKQTSPKRSSPCQREQVVSEPSKKVKQSTEVKENAPAPSKPMFMSAEERFRALFKKK